jgi:hypothetical protein
MLFQVAFTAALKQRETRRTCLLTTARSPGYQTVVAELDIAADFEHVNEMPKIMAYPVLSIPALVVNEAVKVAGRMPSKEETAGWLKA